MIWYNVSLDVFFCLEIKVFLFRWYIGKCILVSKVVKCVCVVILLIFFCFYYINCYLNILIINDLYVMNMWYCFIYCLYEFEYLLLVYNIKLLGEMIYIKEIWYW